MPYIEKPAAQEKEPSKWEQFFEYASDVSKGMLAGQADIAKSKIATQQKMKEIQMQYGLQAKKAQMTAAETSRRTMAAIAERERLRKERPGQPRVFSTFREAEVELNKLGDAERYIVIPVAGGYQIKPRSRVAGGTFFDQTMGGGAGIDPLGIR